MDWFSVRANLLAQATDLRHQLDAHRRAVDRAIADIDGMAAKSRATIRRSCNAIERVSRSLARDNPPRSLAPHPVAAPPEHAPRREPEDAEVA